MGKKWTIEDLSIEIKDGYITINEEEAGTVFQELQHGYHPSIKLVIFGTPNIIHWIELDTEDIIEVVVNKTVELYKNKGVSS